MKSYNFRKADWKRFFLLPGESVERLPPPDGRRKNYVPCWDKKCETHYRSILRAPLETDSVRATSSLLSRIDQKEQWDEAVNSIDFSHSSRKAWSTINNLSRGSGHSSRLCPISAKSMASQLVKSGAHKTRYRESTRLVNKMSDLWNMEGPIFQHLREIVSLASSRQRRILTP